MLSLTVPLFIFSVIIKASPSVEALYLRDLNYAAATGI